MPIVKLKRVWDYCSYNKPFFAFIAVLMFIIGLISSYASDYLSLDWRMVVDWSISILLTGYGLSITRDRINHGYRLPKIIPKDVLILGIKGSIVYTVYIAGQIFILYSNSSPGANVFPSISVNLSK